MDAFRPEHVYALALRPKTPEQRWQARLVDAEGGAVVEFETLADLVQFLVRVSDGVPRTPQGGIR